MLFQENFLVTLGTGINTILNKSATQAVLIESTNSKKSAKKPDTTKSDDIEVKVHIPTPSSTQPTAIKSKGEPTASSSPPASAIEAIKHREIESFTQVFTSLSELQKQYDANLNIGAQNTGNLVTMDVSHIQKKSTQELYYVLELRCKEVIHKLAQPVQVYKPVQDMLGKVNTSAGLKDFSAMYGDSYVDSVTYGRWAFVVIQFRVNSIDDQHALSAKLAQVASSVNVGPSYNYSFSKEFQDEECTIYLYTGGMDYTAAGLILSMSAVDSLMKKFSVQDQQSDPTQISWTCQPYKVAINGIPNAMLLDQITVAARELNRLIEKSRKAIRICLHALNVDKADPLMLATDIANADPDLSTFITFKNHIELCDAKLEEEAYRLPQHAYNKHALAKTANTVKIVVNALVGIINTLPQQMFLPAKRIPSERILHFKKHDEKFYFDLHAPDNSDWFKLQLVNQEDAKPLSLEELVNLKSKIKELKLRKDILKTTSKTKHRKDPSYEAKPIEAHTLRLATMPLDKNNQSNAIPITRKLSQLYFKAGKNNAIKYNVDIKIYFPVKIPKSDLLPRNIDVDRVVDRIKELTPALSRESSFSSLSLFSQARVSPPMQSGSDPQRKRSSTF